MLSAAKQIFRTSLSAAGLDVRVASNIIGADPIQDIKKFHRGGAFKTVVDIGANVGQSALKFHETFPEAAIHSFEPVAASYRAGQQNTAKCPAVTWHHLAVGNTNGRIVFYSSGTSQMNKITNTGTPSSEEKGERNEVEVVRFDDFLAANRLDYVDLLKTDTEGHDLAVLEGAEATLAKRRIGYVLCEAGFTDADKNHSYFPPIAAFLERFGYRLFCFYGLSNIEHFERWGYTYADALFTVPGPSADLQV